MIHPADAALHSRLPRMFGALQRSQGAHVCVGCHVVQLSGLVLVQRVQQEFSTDS